MSDAASPARSTRGSKAKAKPGGKAPAGKASSTRGLAFGKHEAWTTRCTSCNAFANKGCTLSKCRKCCGKDGPPCALHLEEIQST